MPAPPATAAPAAPDCRVFELRRYTPHPGRRDALIDVFDSEFVDSREAVGIRLLGQFRDLGDMDRFVWLRDLEPPLRPWLAKPMQALRLAPTARSALHA